jgi:hypothetical protein
MSKLGMSKGKVMGLALILTCVTPLSVPAGDFDGSKPLTCAVIDVVECVPGGQCEERMPGEIDIVQFLQVDVTKKTITGTRAGGIKRTSAIEHIEHVDGKVIIQGAEDGVEGVRDGLGWSMAISEETGKMVVTGSGDEVAFVVFGACMAQ